jgi:hypothetical protein
MLACKLLAFKKGCEGVGGTVALPDVKSSFQYTVNPEEPEPEILAGIPHSLIFKIWGRRSGGDSWRQEVWAQTRI